MEEGRMTCRGWTMDELSSNEEEKRRPAETMGYGVLNHTFS